MRSEISEIVTINSLPTTTDEWRKSKLERINFINDFCKDATFEIEKCDNILNNVSNIDEAIDSMCKIRNALNYYLNLDRKTRKQYKYTNDDQDNRKDTNN